MFSFLCKTIFLRRHIIDSIPPTTLQRLLCVQNQWLFSVRYCHSNASDRHSFAVSYFIDTCGFTPQEVASLSKRVSFETREKPDWVIKFLQNHEFSQAQIFYIIKTIPVVLRLHSGKNFLSKFDFFKSRGASSSDIPALISSCPSVLRRSLKKQLIPSFDFFRNLFQSDPEFIKVLKYYSGILFDVNTHALPNMKLLREVGVSESNIIKFLQYFPRAVALNHVGFKKIVEEVKELGFNPLTFQFVLATYALASLSKSKWAKTTNVYKKWGWSDKDILVAFRRYPFCMTASEDKINAIMEFLLNKMGCESSTISKYPAVMSFSLNKRFVPRGAVIQVLLSKGKVKKKTLLTVFMYPEKVFLEFIQSHDREGSELLKMYEAKLDLAR